MQKKHYGTALTAVPPIFVPAGTRSAALAASSFTRKTAKLTASFSSAAPGPPSSAASETLPPDRALSVHPLQATPAHLRLYYALLYPACRDLSTVFPAPTAIRSPCRTAVSKSSRELRSRSASGVISPGAKPSRMLEPPNSKYPFSCPQRRPARRAVIEKPQHAGGRFFRGKEAALSVSAGHGQHAPFPCAPVSGGCFCKRARCRRNTTMAAMAKTPLTSTRE